MTLHTAIYNSDGTNYDDTCSCIECRITRGAVSRFQSNTIYVDRAGTASSKHPFISERAGELIKQYGYAEPRITIDFEALKGSGPSPSIIDELCGVMGKADLETASPADEGAKRKATPIWSGVMRYFPDALAAVARLSKAGNDKHNPGQPLHWARDKSTDHGDCIARHQMEPEQIDCETGELHAAAVAWRALAQLQLLEEKRLGKGVLDVTPKVAEKKWSEWFTGTGFQPSWVNGVDLVECRSDAGKSAIAAAEPAYKMNWFPSLQYRVKQ